VVTAEHMRSVRPGFGAHPKYLDSLIGKKAKRDLTLGDRVELSDFE